MRSARDRRVQEFGSTCTLFWLVRILIKVAPSFSNCLLLSNTWFLGPKRVYSLGPYTPNRFAVGSTVFAHLSCVLNIQTTLAIVIIYAARVGDVAYNEEQLGFTALRNACKTTKMSDIMWLRRSDVNVS